MGQWIIIYSVLFCMYMPGASLNTGVNGFSYAASIQENNISAQKIEEVPTAMDALDAVQKKYTANFEKVYDTGQSNYYYKLPGSEYYLVYEGLQNTGDQYLIHLYEFVTDEPDTGIGHTVTYGWFTVDCFTGEIMEYGWE